mmetsp:Transcript_14340/g.30104  ORF Transcript_14340/g.30104 Transcript_14340/m.30104 type:complete len:112 (-) Transcript_14340:1092-1427(-)
MQPCHRHHLAGLVKGRVGQGRLVSIRLENEGGRLLRDSSPRPHHRGLQQFHHMGWMKSIDAMLYKNTLFLFLSIFLRFFPSFCYIPILHEMWLNNYLLYTIIIFKSNNLFF